MIYTSKRVQNFTSLPDLVKSGLSISNHYPCHYHQNHFRTRQPDMIESLSAALEVPSRLARVTCWIASSLIKFIDASVVSELLSGVLGHSEEGLDTCWTLSSELFDDLDGMHKIFA